MTDEIGNGAHAPRSAPAGPVVTALIAVIRVWALFGGLIIAGLALMTAASAASNLLFRQPFSPDYELTKHFVAVAIFMFLPYCQLVGANVAVDIFTEHMSAQKKAMMAVLSSLLAVAFSVLLLRQMALGLASYLRFPEVTPVLGLPLWTAFPPILASLALLLVASVLTAWDGWRGTRGLPSALPPHHIPVE